MAYHVDLSQRAQRDFGTAYDYIAAEAPQAAIDFRYGLQERVDSLKTFPQRCSIAPEDQHRDETIRQTFYKSYRVMFIIRDETVYVVHIRHGARREMTAEETAEL